MTSFVAKTAAKKLMGKKLQDKFGQGDPYYEKVPGTKRNGEPTGKQVKQKRGLPPGVSGHDAEVLMAVRRRVHHLDWSLFTIFGVGFGWSTVIGIIPGIGDAIDGLMSLSVFRKCCKVEGGLPVSVKLHMMVNVVIDFIIGLVPGAEAIYRGNTRNALLLEDFLRERAEKALRKTKQLPDHADTEVRRRGRKPARREESGIQRYERHFQDDIIVPDEFSDEHRAIKKRLGRR
ncbi:PH domain protein [Metarhizium rileyi]|uniref:PH domain protein n=1 Tax=Metarhizium rileyi (strain RCEF 4871) TaxID=1649241 RepID=A0A167F6W3_METRR|nr:PH domain protein [Metarhizium rileyi RCEF 4871]TWU74781.1 hypothetical protein ED733_006096 [Metarhizium rileyi]